MGIQKPQNNGLGVHVSQPASGVPSVSNTSTPEERTASGPATTTEHILTPNGH